MADTPTASPETAPAATPYRVLARRYRPKNFGELIGQDAMVRTLRNAFAHDRIPQAWMLTGVRGVGKTTTARILARALNFEVDGERRPTVDLDRLGAHCEAIMEGRHIDVIEMDAASHTGIGDIREIIDAARYKPVSALYKVYIIDEVHMLSTAAFNGLLKTLEEPPAHVKFIFATTEIRKVPVTILSRCQRFDLRRVEEDVLARHLVAVATREGLTLGEEPARLLTRAAEGSVRDALSLLDQAIAHGAGVVEAEGLRDMLGLADRTRILDLFEMVMRGKVADALEELADQYAAGADPVAVLTELSSFTHRVARLKATGAAPEAGEAQTVRERLGTFAGELGMAALSRMWQALLAGLTEVQAAPKPYVAAEMVLIRLAYMASLPDPSALPLSAAPGTERPAPANGGSSAGGGDRRPGPAAPMASASQPSPPSATALAMPTTFAEVAALVGSQSLRLKHAVERDMRLKRFERGRIEVTLLEGAAPGAVGALGEALTRLTGERWVVTVSEGASAPTLNEVRTAEQDRLKADAMEEPLVRAIMETFADARVTAVRIDEGTGATDEAAAPSAPAAPPRTERG